jgi:hypothetical protein
MEKIKFNPEVSTEKFSSSNNLRVSTYTVKQATEKRRVTLQIGFK